MKFKQIIRDYFSFTKNERIGLIVLIVLIILFFAANQLIFYFETPSVADKEKFFSYLEEINQANLQNQKELVLFDFDPNVIDSVALDSLDLPDRVKSNLLKYRKSGGHFYNPDEIQKIYGMNDSIYESIFPYVKIQMQEPEFIAESVTDERKISNESFDGNEIILTRDRESTEKPANIVIEINTASADEFKSLYGIGDVLSERIVKYRELLGGFYSTNQLTEVYGLSPEVVESITDQLRVDTTILKKININFADKDQLAAHPYIDWDEAQAIQDYKDKIGFINELNQLNDDSVIDMVIFSKIRHYLKTND